MAKAPTCNDQLLSGRLFADVAAGVSASKSHWSAAFRAAVLSRSFVAFGGLWRQDTTIDADAVAAAAGVGVHIVHEDPKIWLAPNFLSDAEVDELLAAFESRWEASGVQSGHGHQFSSLMLRSSRSASLDWAQTPGVHALEQRLAELAGMGIDHLEGLVGVRYAPGEFFSVHHDSNEKSSRPMTVFLYLNDLPEGDDGETRFPLLGLKVRPRKGAAVMWANCGPDGKEDMRLCHHALPPRSAVKYGVNCFFHEAPVRRAGEPDDEGDDGEEWTIELAKADSAARLGLVTHVSRGTIVVDIVKDGLIAEWNWASPAKAVQARDRIVAVNGVSCDTDQMYEAYQRASVVTIVIRRPAPRPV